MSHINQFTERAVYDAERGELAVQGATNEEPGGPPPLAIHVAVKQLTPEGSLAAAAAGSVSQPSLGDPDWEVRLSGDFGPGPATAFGVEIEFAGDVGAFETFVWARTITIEPGTLPDDPADG